MSIIALMKWEILWVQNIKLKNFKRKIIDVVHLKLLNSVYMINVIKFLKTMFEYK